VINDVGARDGKLVENVRNQLISWKVPIAETAVAHRVAYINAITTGKAGQEKDRRAAEEIESLWVEIKAALRTAAKVRAA
jgi:hypothetical protein